MRLDRFSSLRSAPAFLLLTALLACAGRGGGGSAPTPVTDSAPPTVTALLPAEGATGVGLGSTLQATFSEPMDTASLVGGAFTLQTSGTAVPGTVMASGVTATFTPAAPLGSGLTYTATVGTGARDLAGNALASARAWTFTVQIVDGTPPTVVARSPLDGATGVQAEATVSVTFSEDIKAASVASSAFSVSDGGSALAGSLSLNGRQLTWTAASPLPLGRRLDATLGTGIQDLAGNVLAAPVAWSFTTQAPPDTLPPTVTATQPAAGALGLSADTVLTATFSEDLDPSMVTATTCTLARTADGQAVPATVSLAGNLVTLRSSSPLVTATYTATLGTGIKDLAGNAMAAPYSWSFTVDATAQWNTPGILHEHLGIASEPNLLMTQSGLAAVVWVEEVAAGDARIHLRRYDPTTGWAPLQIHQDLVKLGVFQAALQEDGTLWILSRRRKLSGSGSEMVAVNQSLAGAWSPAALLGLPQDESMNEPVLGVDNSGRAFGAWLASTRLNDGTLANLIRMARHLPGTGWEAPNGGELFPLPAYTSAQKLNLRMNGAGQGVVAWEHLASNGSFRTAMGCMLTSALHGAPTPLSAVGIFARNPVGHLNASGAGTVIYTTFDPTQTPALSTVKALPFTAGGGWGSPVEVYNGLETAMEPSVAVDAAGGVLLGWVQAPLADAQAGSIQRAEAPAGGSFNTPVTVQPATSSPGAGTRTLAAVSDSGRALQGWSFFYNNRRFRFYSAVRDQGLWSGPLPVESSPISNAGISGHALTLDAQGRGLVTWIQGDASTKTYIWWSRIP